jgi:hypothetical protein
MADRRAWAQALRFSEALVPALNAGAVNLPNKQIPQLIPDTLQNGSLAILGFLLAAVLLQYRSISADAVLIARRQPLSEAFGQFV